MRNNNSKNVFLSFSWLLFILCTTGLASLGFKCVQKYRERPKAVDISIHPQYELDYPVFTLCPMGSEEYYPPPMNLTNINKCGLSMSDMVVNGTIIGSGSSECDDPEKFWESITLKLGDFGLQSIWALYEDATYESLSLEEDDHAWKRYISIEFNGQIPFYETCYSLRLPKQLKNLNQLNINTDTNVTLKAYVHDFGFLNHVFKATSIQYGKVSLQSSGTQVEVKYSQHIEVEDNAGKPCKSDESFSLTFYNLNKTEQVFFLILID